MELHSRGGGGTSPQGPIPKKKSKEKKSRRKKLTGSRSQVPPQRAVFELCTQVGSQTSDPWRGVALVFFVVHPVLFEGVYSHTEKQMRGQRMHCKITNREGRAFV